jgi:hypothetical protein
MTVPEVLVLEHAAYLTERAYRRALHLEVRRQARKRRQTRMTVVHDRDGSCCRREKWSETFARLVQALRADGLPTLGLVPGGADASAHDAAVDRALGRSV